MKTLERWVHLLAGRISKQSWRAWPGFSCCSQQKWGERKTIQQKLKDLGKIPRLQETSWILRGKHQNNTNEPLKGRAWDCDLFFSHFSRNANLETKKDAKMLSGSGIPQAKQAVSQGKNNPGDSLTSPENESNSPQVLEAGPSRRG